MYTVVIHNGIEPLVLLGFRRYADISLSRARAPVPLKTLGIIGFLGFQGSITLTLKNLISGNLKATLGITGFLCRRLPLLSNLHVKVLRRAPKTLKVVPISTQKRKDEVFT